MTTEEDSKQGAVVSGQNDAGGESTAKKPVVQRKSLGYDPSKLDWNLSHTQNTEGKYCYCGEDRELFNVQLFCSGCRNWFHERCLRKKITHMLPYVMNYSFTCLNCLPASEGEEQLCEERVERTSAGWREVHVAVIANLSLEKMKERLAARGLSTGEKAGEVVDGITNSKYNKNVHHRLDELEEKDLYYFRKNENIVPFIDRHWAFVCQGRTRTTTWAATVGAGLYTHKALFHAHPGGARTAASPFTLVHPDLFDINPDTFTLVDGSVVAKAKPPSSVSSAGKSALSSSHRKLKGDGAASVGFKRKVYNEPASQNLVSERRSRRYRSNQQTSDPTSIRVSQEYPVNKTGYRYTFAENDPHVAYGWREGSTYGYQNREHVLMSIQDRAGQLRFDTSVSSAAATVVQQSSTSSSARGKNFLEQQRQQYLHLMGDKGYCSARATHGVSAGTWYFEVEVLTPDPERKCSVNDAHCRLGWSQKYAELQAPCGYDDFGYSYRDKYGTAFHKAHGHRYGDSFTTGDVIGLMICLPSEAPSVLPRAVQCEAESGVTSEGKEGRSSRSKSSQAKAAEATVKAEVTSGPLLSNATFKYEEAQTSMTTSFDGKLINLNGTKTTEEEDEESERANELIETDAVNICKTKKILVDYKGHSYYEEKYNSTDVVKTLRPLKGSKIMFFKNGTCQGVAFSDINGGMYFPTISLYMGARVKVNFGPEFKHTPDKGKFPGWQAMSDMGMKSALSDIVSDMVLKVESGCADTSNSRKGMALGASVVKKEEMGDSEYESSGLEMEGGDEDVMGGGEGETEKEKENSVSNHGIGEDKKVTSIGMKSENSDMMEIEKPHGTQ
eukprot:Nk52_evm11s1400 gene=Nk52_evmTU11s1400